MTGAKRRGPTRLKRIKGMWGEDEGQRRRTEHKLRNRREVEKRKQRRMIQLRKRAESRVMTEA